MTDNEIVRALRSLAVSRDNKCDNPTVMMIGKELVLNTAANRIESLQAQFAEVTQLALEVTGKYETSVKMHQITNTALSASQASERAARNELCQRCGRYREAHKGACDGCRWKGEAK